MRILVTDGDERAALAVVRSLGRHGHHVIVAAASARSVSGSSRFAREQVRLPDPLRQSPAYLDALVRVTRERRVDALIPITEASLRLVLPARERFGDLLIPFPDAATFRAASDKRGILATARRLGLHVPEQRVIGSRDEGLAAAVEVTFPVVLKPAASVVATGERNERQEKLGVRHAADPAGYRAVLESLPSGAFPLLVQRRVVGPGCGIFLLRWGGRTVARFAHRRIREKPPSGGVSVYRESVAAPAEWIAAAERLLEALDWSGVAMVEYKVDRDTGAPYLMEVNGRFWGSLQLAVDAGVDFPVLLVEAALGHTPGTPPHAAPGVRLRWELGDLDHLLARLRRSDSELALPDDAPGRWRAIASVLRPWRRGERWEVLRPSDPRPFFTELRRWVRQAVGRGPE